MVLRRNEGIREVIFVRASAVMMLPLLNWLFKWIMDAFIILKNSTHRCTDAYMPYSWVHLAKVIGYLLQNVHLSILCSDFLFNLTTSRQHVRMHEPSNSQTRVENILKKNWGITFKLDKRRRDIFCFWLVLHLSNYESGLRLLISRSSAPLNTHISLEILAQLSHLTPLRTLCFMLNERRSQHKP